VLAIAQIGVHLVFFLHITTGPDNTNNVLALAFGLLVIRRIMSNLNAHMPPMDARKARLSAWDRPVHLAAKK
jgi:cytochrome o ubiquinol oxidase operon protein cyoD